MGLAPAPTSRSGRCDGRCGAHAAKASRPKSLFLPPVRPRLSSNQEARRRPDLRPALCRGGAFGLLMIERLDRLGLGWLALRGIHGFHEYVAFGVALPLSELMGDVAQGIRPSRAACSTKTEPPRWGPQISLDATSSARLGAIREWMHGGTFASSCRRPLEFE
jgi:hypothetical protein